MCKRRLFKERLVFLRLHAELHPIVQVCSQLCQSSRSLPLQNVLAQNSGKRLQWTETKFDPCTTVHHVLTKKAWKSNEQDVQTSIMQARVPTCKAHECEQRSLSPALKSISSQETTYQV